jgi:hypothetical protein
VEVEKEIALVHSRCEERCSNEQEGSSVSRFAPPGDVEELKKRLLSVAADFVEGCHLRRCIPVVF